MRRVKALALGLICSKCHSPYRGRAISRGINPSTRALTRLIPLKTKHTHLLTYNNYASIHPLSSTDDMCYWGCPTSPISSPPGK